MKRMLVSLVLLLASPAYADWVLNGDESALSFVSTKAINIAEVHRFGALSGGVDADGNVSVAIDLASVDTGIELRDDRMRSMLFDTENFAAAALTAMVDTAAIAEMTVGESRDMTVQGTLSLHGETRPLTMEVAATRSGDSKLLVVSKKPVVINAPEFKLSEGVEALRAIAGLDSISLAVPVSFILAFESD